MEAHNIKQFTKQYFEAHHCYVNEKDNGLLEVQLTEEMDEKIMNRPFYWHYVRATKNKGVPQTLLLETHNHNDDQDVEHIYYGSTRFQQILSDLTKDTHFIQAFESIETTENQAMYPWLLVNIKITYNSMQTKDEIFSLGLNLITGKIIVNMMEHLEDIQLDSTISSLCYILSPIITYESGFKRMEHILDVYLEEQSHTWAIRSIQAMEDELHLLNIFYEKENEEKLTEMTAVKKRYEPRIEFQVLSGGILYLQKDFLVEKEK